MGEELDRVAADELEETLRELRKKSAGLAKEKDDLTAKVDKLTKENDSLKKESNQQWLWVLVVGGLIVCAAVCGR